MISELNPAELLRKIAHLERAQELSSTGSWEWDIVSGDITWTDQIYRIFGLPPGAFRPTYLAFLERVHPDDRELVDRAVGRAIEGRGVYDIQHRIVLPDTRLRIVQEQGRAEYGEDGQAIRMLGAVQDVTELRNAEAALRQNEEILGGMLGASPEAIVVCDSNSKVLLFSAGAELTFGYAAAELVGLGVEQLMPLRFRNRHQHHVDNFICGPSESIRMDDRSEIVGLRRNGEEFPAEASVVRMETPKGVMFTTIIRDLSERKLAEQSLRDAKELAEAANRAKSAFLANMSHEIRTPLNGVLGVAGALARTDLTAQQRGMLQTIEASGQALQALLGDILDLSKVDAGRLAIRDEPFNLAGLIEETSSLFRASALAKGIDLQVELSELVLGDFVGDALRIQQAISNLLSNAIKFTHQGEVCLKVRLVAQSGGICRVCFVVEDTGIGFDPAEVDELFGRFEQVDNASTREFGGVGLGLALTKSLVELMGGKIAGTSSPGSGASFAFELPLPRIAPGAMGPPAPVGRLDGERSWQSPAEAMDRPIRVLLAEDHPVNRLVVELILAGLPVDLTSVENGEEAVQAATARPFDLILMDLQMPVMDGLEAIRLIRAREIAAQAKRTPICTLTANALPEFRAASDAAGADEFLTKPINAEALISVVLRAATPSSAVM